MSAGGEEKRSANRFRLIAVIGVACLALLYGLRLSILETVGEALLQSYGFEAASLNVADVSFTEIQINELILDDKLIAENLSAGYTVQSLVRGNIEWVSLSGLILDVSNPGEGALGTIISLANRPDERSDDTTAGPSLKLANGSVFGNYANQNFKSKVTLNISSDGQVAGEASFYGEITEEAGLIVAEGLVLSFDGRIPEKSANLSLKSGVLRHAVSTPQWAPINLSGSSSFKENVIEFLVGAGLGEEIPLMRAEGRHSLDTGVGNLVLDIQDVAFNRGGLQPSDLSPYFDTMPSLDVTLSNHSLIAWNKAQIISENEIILREMRLDIGGISYEGKNTKINLDASIDLKTGEQQASLLLSDAFATVLYDNQKYALNNMKAALKVEKGGDVVSLNNISASLSHLSDEPNFVPLHIQSKGKKEGPDFVFDGEVADKDEHLQLPFDGRYIGGDKSAFIRGRLSHKKFVKGGFQPKHFSRYFKDFDDEVTGHSVMAGILAWHPEEGLSIPFVSVNLKQFGYAGKEFRVEDAKIQIKAQKVKFGAPIQVEISNGSATVFEGNRKAKIADATALLSVDEGWESAEFLVSGAQIQSVKGFAIKPIIEISGSSRITKNSLMFKGAAKTDLLGSFLEWEGTHNIKQNVGSVFLNFSALEFKKGGVQPSDLITGVERGLIFTGGITPELFVNWGQEGVKSRGKFTFNELGVKAEDFDLLGISGKIEVDELQPLLISLPQEITAKKVTSAVIVDHPTLVFRVGSKNGNPVLYVDRLALEIAGGQALIENAVLDAGANRNQLEIQFLNLDLEKVMAFTEAEAVTASGILNGQIPVVFEDDKVFVERGVLETKGPGILQLKSDQARQALVGGGDQTKLLFDILENFQYSELAIKIKKQASGEDTVALHTKGANPDVENSRPIVLNINLSTNLDRIFSTLLDGYRLSEKALRATVKNRKN